jgi:hypothetical protein
MRLTNAVYLYRSRLSGGFSDFHDVEELRPLLHGDKQDAGAAPIRL